MMLADEAAHSTLFSIEPNTDSKHIYIIEGRVLFGGPSGSEFSPERSN